MGVGRADPGPVGPTRAQLVRGTLGLALASVAPRPFAAADASATQTKMNTRPIPSTREPLPVIGCGTYIGFDQAPGTPAYALLPGVVDALLDAGGKVLDSSPMYGRAEETTGELLAASGRRGEAFLATKVWTRGRSDGVAPDGSVAAAPAQRAHRPDADPQPARLAHPSADLAALEGRGPDPLSRHHALHVVGVRRGRVGAARRDGSTSCRSTTPSTTARPSGACCRSPPNAASR